MNVLEIGGSGFVGELVNPYLRESHNIRVLDRVPPRDPSLEFVEGSVLSSEDLAAGMDGMDAVLYLAMGKDPQGSNQQVQCSYDVNVQGVHHALEAAANAGIRRVVYTSTLSIYGGVGRPGRLQSEEEVGDSQDVYGFTKRLGEEVCEFFSRSRNLSCIVLRLMGPRAQEDWENEPQSAVYGLTGASDLSRAFDAALTCEHEGFAPIFIAGDPTERVCGLARAREILGWMPTPHPGNGHSQG